MKKNEETELSFKVSFKSFSNFDQLKEDLKSIDSSIEVLMIESKAIFKNENQKTSSIGSAQKQLLKILKPNSNVQKFLLFLILIIVVALGSAYYGALLQRDSSMGGFRQALYYSLKSNISIPINYLKGKINSNANNISLDIKHKDLQKIAYNRKLAYQQGGILESDYFPARLRYKGKSYKVGVRLSGKALDHVNTDKWSLRVKVKDNKTILGMKKV